MKMKTLLISLILFIITGAIAVASSFYTAKGTFIHEGISLTVNHDDIYNIYRDRDSQEVVHKHYSKSRFKLIAEKGTHIKDGAYLLVGKKKHSFQAKNTDKKGYFSQSREIEVQGHIHNFSLVYSYVSGDSEPVELTKQLTAAPDHTGQKMLPNKKLIIKEAKD